MTRTIGHISYSAPGKGNWDLNWWSCFLGKTDRTFIRNKNKQHKETKPQTKPCTWESAKCARLQNGAGWGGPLNREVCEWVSAFLMASGSKRTCHLLYLLLFLSQNTWEKKLKGSIYFSLQFKKGSDRSGGRAWDWAGPGLGPTALEARKQSWMVLLTWLPHLVQETPLPCEGSNPQTQHHSC